jgi:hypothetical protein
MESMGQIFGGGGSSGGGGGIWEQDPNLPSPGGWTEKPAPPTPAIGGATAYDPGPEGGGVSTPYGSPGSPASGGSGIPTGSYGKSPVGGGSGIGDIGKVLGSLGTAGGGIMGLVNSFRDSPTEKLMAKQQKLGMQNAQATSSAGQQQLQQYSQGQLSAPQQAAVDKFKKEQIAKWNQYFAAAGIPASSAQADMMAKVDQDAAAYAQSLLQQNFQNSVSALGLSGNTLAQQSAMNLAYEKEIAKSQADAMNAIGQLGGLLNG